MIAQSTPDLIRPYLSFDYDDIFAVVMVLLIIVGYFVNRWTPSRSRTKTETHSESIVVDADMVAQFVELTSRLTKVELESAGLRLELNAALVRIHELERLEEFLSARLHERGQELEARERDIERLQLQLESYRVRLAALERLVTEKLGIEALDGLPGVHGDGDE